MIQQNKLDLKMITPNSGEFFTRQLMSLSLKENACVKSQLFTKIRSIYENHLRVLFNQWKNYLTSFVPFKVSKNPSKNYFIYERYHLTFF